MKLTDVKENPAFLSHLASPTAPGKLGAACQPMSSSSPQVEEGMLWSLASEHNKQVPGPPRLPWAKNCSGIAKDQSAEACCVRVQGWGSLLLLGLIARTVPTGRAVHLRESRHGLLLFMMAGMTAPMYFSSGPL